MKRRKGSKGAVTVLVTLLLVPALLITGSGVDIARIYTARSIVQDANQMAANAALTQYDAMLQDLYGLFAISTEDENLQQMVTDYVNLSLYGDENPQPGSGDTGAFALFSGSVSSTKVETQKSLGKTEIKTNSAAVSELRHQIEEYAKFRAPVAIASEVIDRLKAFDQIKANSEVIKDKSAIDDLVSDLYDLCKKALEAINAANKIREEQQSLNKELNGLLNEVNRQFDQMVIYREKYEKVKPGSSFEEEEKEEYRAAYEVHLYNILKVIDGNNNSNIHVWVEGGMNDEGEWENGKTEVEKTIPRSIITLEKHVASQDNRTHWSDLMDKMVNACVDLDKRCEKIQENCAALREKLKSSECTPELAKEIKEQLDEYEKLALAKAEPMAQEVRNKNNQILESYATNFQINAYGAMSKDNVPRVQESIPFDSISKVVNLQRDEACENFVATYPDLQIDVEINQKKLQKEHYDVEKLYRLAEMDNYHYHDRYRYLLFGDSSAFGDDNKDFYNLLKEIVKDLDDSKADQATTNIVNFFSSILKELEGLYDYKPQGAKYYKAPATEEGEEPFGKGGSWGNKDDITKEINSGMEEVNILLKGLDQVSRKVLLVAYGSEMFSCYTDENTKENPDAERRISLAGVPMDTNVNYFYQSELEYLYNGNIGSAAANLMAVSGTILLIRFMFNYVATFTITEVKTVISSIKASIGAVPVIGTALGIAIGELARFAFGLGEAVLDLTDMRNGKAVPLFKTNETWQLSIGNLADRAMTMARNGKNSATNTVETQNGWYYIDYLRIFLLLKDGNKIAERMEDLIELNVTNAKNKVYQKGQDIAGSEGKITEKDYFELDKQAVSVKVSTEVELRFLFFPLGYFQKGINGAVAPTSAVLNTEDYRGY